MDVQTLHVFHVEAITIRGIEKVLVADEAADFYGVVAERRVAVVSADIADMATTEIGG